MGTLNNKVAIGHSSATSITFLSRTTPNVRRSLFAPMNLTSLGNGLVFSALLVKTLFSRLLLRGS